MRALVFLIGIILVAPLLAQEVYRWVDDDGHLHYSDRPREGAETVELSKAQTFSAPPVATSPAQPDAGERFKYDKISIARPDDEETIWNTGNQVDVSLTLSPRLRRGDKLMWYVDGQLQSNVSTRSTSATLSDIWRGTHQLVAEVQDINGNSLNRSSPVTFEYRMTSALSPLNNAANPPPVVGPVGGGP